MGINLEEHFDVRTEPKVLPYIIFIDDTESHFSSSRIVYGLLVKPTESELELSKSAHKRWLNNTKDFATYDNKLGISNDGFKALSQCVHQNYSNIRSIILDWDKTLTVHGSFRTNEMNKYIAECYFGGWRRMKNMKEFFKTCKDKQIHVAILTCNSRAKTLAGKALFLQALYFVDAKNVDVHFTDKTKIAHINTLAVQ